MGVFNIIKRSILAGLLALTFAVANFSCAYAAQEEKPVEIVASDQFKIAQLSAGQLIDEYRLSKYDVINVMVVGFPDGIGVNDIMVGPDGYVQLPYAGMVKLAGLNIQEATALISEKLAEYIKIPNLSVMIKTYGPRKIYVMGEVKKPGIYPLAIDSMNVYAAISSAEGVATHGRPKHIQVLRSIGDTMYYKEVNIDAFIKKHDLSQNLALQDGDIVYVPASNKIDITEDILPLVSLYGVYRGLTN